MLDPDPDSINPDPKHQKNQRKKCQLAWFFLFDANAIQKRKIDY